MNTIQKLNIWFEKEQRAQIREVEGRKENREW